MQKQRLDHLLVTRGLAENRSKAQALIMAGLVSVGDTPATKAGQTFADDADIRLKGKEHPWVSRGGMKLAHAIASFNLQAQGLCAMDVGASTGGFTDVLLHHGAAQIYAVDVGHGQLDWKLRQDPRVVVLEKTNARHLTSAQIPTQVDIIVCDASFISLKTVLATPLTFASPTAWLVALIKPQFEAGRAQVGKGGIVRDSAVHQSVCEDITAWMGAQTGWSVEGITPSPIMGAEGNKEFLLVARKHPSSR
jgi:23S rRNA (cytidine1920-2'-O)/16S rRNA (cytidine1409-2'-O)-methyltransferase